MSRKEAETISTEACRATDTDQGRGFQGGQEKVSCQIHIEAGIFAVKRERREILLHLQGDVMPAFALYARTFTVRLSRYLGFTVVSHRNHLVANIRTRIRKNTRMHPFNGLVSYCNKDRHRPWFSSMLHNITAAIIQDGKCLFRYNFIGTFRNIA